MSELNRIKQAMADGEHTDGDLQWCVEEIERLRGAHEQIIRECDALNKGPRAVMIAKAALEGKKDG